MKDPLEDVQLDRRQALLTPFLIVAILVASFAVFSVARAAILIGLGIAASIMLHECGHYVAAKRANMKVTEFFVGFGPRIWSVTKGETEYGIKAIPLGGYVRIIGMSNLEEVAPEDEPRTFRQASYKDKALVAVAGVSVNVIIFIICTFIVLVGRGLPADEPSAQLGFVETSMPAYAAGLRDGDWIVGANGEPVPSWDSLPELIGATASDTAAIPLMRGEIETGIEAEAAWLSGTDPQLVVDSENVVTKVSGDAADAGVEVGDQFDLSPVELTFIRNASTTNVQLDPSWIDNELVLSDDNVVLTASGAAAAAGFEEGDRIAVANYESAGTPAMVLERAGDASSIQVTVLRNGTERTESITPELGAVTLENGSIETVGRVGISPEFAYRRSSPIVAAKDSVVMIGTQTAAVFDSIQRVFSPSGISNHASAIINGEPEASTASAAVSAEASRPRSVVGIVDIGSSLVNADFWMLFALLAALNLFLALFNMIPLLPFDGGHLVVATYEAAASKITKRRIRVDYRKLLPVTTVVTGIVILYGVSVMFRDLRSVVVG